MAGKFTTDYGSSIPGERSNELPPVVLIPPLCPTSEFEREVRALLDDLGDLLVEKNRKYGDAALNPKRIFSRASAVEQIKVRLDDKITRLMNQQPDEDEDVERDLMGYLVLLRLAKARLASENPIK